MYEVGVRPCWVMAQAISDAAACQKQSRAAECIQPDVAGPTNIQGGGGEVIESSSVSRNFVFLKF